MQYDNKFHGFMSFLIPWIKRDEKEFDLQVKTKIDSFAAPDKADGANEIERTDMDTTALSKAMQQSFYTSTPKLNNTRDLINQYRNLCRYSEVDNAIDEIVNDAIVFEEHTECVALDLESTKWSESVKEKVKAEFEEVLRLLDFQKEGKRLFRKWYVDGRIYFHKMIDPENTKAGIQELRRVDPRFVEYTRELNKTTDVGAGAYAYTSSIEYFTYDNTNDPRYTITNTQRQVKIPRSAMVYAHSGKVDVDGKSVIGYLHTAIKPANQLKMLEDALVIFRITRAPERRVFYIDVGNMQPKKATEHLNKTMQGLKNRVVYDSSTGKVKTATNNLSMTEDYFLPRRDGKAATEVTTLPGAQSSNEIEDIRWFNRKLWEALKIPLSRLPQENGGVMFSAGGEITRDELQFGKLIRAMRVDFSPVILDPLKTNLALKNIVTEAEWEAELNNIRLNFNNDSYFQEIKEIEILERRVQTVMTCAEITGKYFSHEWVQQNILMMSEDDIKEQKEKIKKEADDPTLKNPEDEDNFGEF